MKLITIIGMLIATLLIAGCSSNIEIKNSTADLTEIKITKDTTLREVSQMTGFCMGHIYSDLGITRDVDPYMPIKDIAKTYHIEFSVEKVQAVVDGIRAGKEDHVEGEDHGEKEPEHERYVEETECLLGVENDPFPGMCALYIDQDKDGFCDLG